MRPPARSTPFPYTTLFRSLFGRAPAEHQDLALVQEQLALAVFGVVLRVAVAVGTDARADQEQLAALELHVGVADRKSTRLNSSHGYISYAVFCLKKKKTNH